MQAGSHIANHLARADVREARHDFPEPFGHILGMASRNKLYIREWRNFRGLTLEDLAAALDSSKGYVSELERGIRRYNQDLLEGIAKALKCSPADLLATDPTKPRKPVRGHATDLGLIAALGAGLASQHEKNETLAQEKGLALARLYTTLRERGGEPPALRDLRAFFDAEVKRLEASIDPPITAKSRTS